MHQKKSLVLIFLSIIIPLLLTSCRQDVPPIPYSVDPAIAAGNNHSMILKKDGSVWVTGSNEFGQLGLGDQVTETRTFTRVKHADGSEITSVKAIAAGGFHSMILKEDGTVWVTGANTFMGELSKYKLAGQLGLGLDLAKINTFTKVPFDSSIGKVLAITAGHNHSMIITENGHVLVAGANSSTDGSGHKYTVTGKLGLGNDVEFKLSFTPVITDSTDTAKIQGIAAGYSHSLLLTENGKIYATGSNYFGQLGVGVSGGSNISPTFTQVTDDSNSTLGKIMTIAAGTNQSMILKEDTTVWTTGSNYSGLLGINEEGDKNVFTQVLQEITSPTPLTGAKAIGAGSSYTLILKEDGSLWAAGYNQEGQMGLGSEINSTKVFTQVVHAMQDSLEQNIPKIHAIAAGDRHSLILTEDGNIFATGENTNGQLGIRNNTNTSIFTEVTYLEDII